MNATILLVEDDEALHRGIQFTLQHEGFQVLSARDLEGARILLRDNEIHLLLLDVQLPDGNGFDFCSELRESRDTPIIFLTASDQEFDIVRGLDLGGDDYITKPFRLREFTSRVQAVLRRRGPIAREEEASLLTAGTLSLNVGEMRLEKRGQDVPLSVTEFRLLRLFMTHPRSVLSKDQIIQQVWPDGAEVLDDNTVAVNIRRLREKIEEDPQQPQRIVTVRGAGYRWNG
ncbi:DNA-binding response regulator [Cohnella endophytica]|uniref:DNA-binding response regulator n=1 Tax=Cohnella endophytica TaxID=2419778 RepID=A0A494X837_9BACL|nr:response regulator transcription factor [Cohnella endophytica]RKP44506.1 DNA-binding response regulator [Cohnella endophytica]